MDPKAGKTIIVIVLLLVLGLAGLWAVSAYTSGQSKAQDDLAQPAASALKGKAKQGKP